MPCITAGPVLRIDVKPQIRRAQNAGLRARDAFKIIVDKHDGRMSGFGKIDTVAHGGGSARASGAHAH
jgi:hypothetical protein